MLGRRSDSESTATSATGDMSQADSSPIEDPDIAPAEDDDSGLPF
jgi:hypothetical protein